MYVLVVIMLNATNFATTFDSSFKSFQTKTGCENVANRIMKESTAKGMMDNMVVFCEFDGKESR